MRFTRAIPVPAHLPDVIVAETVRDILIRDAKLEGVEIVGRIGVEFARFGGVFGGQRHAVAYAETLQLKLVNG